MAGLSISFQNLVVGQQYYITWLRGPNMINEPGTLTQKNSGSENRVGFILDKSPLTRQNGPYTFYEFKSRKIPTLRSLAAKAVLNQKGKIPFSDETITALVNARRNPEIGGRKRRRKTRKQKKRSRKTKRR